MKKLFFTFALAVLALTASAVPAKPGLFRTLTLSDGTTVKAQLVGDEHGHYWLSADGRAYQQMDGMAYFSEVSIETVKAKAQARRSQANARRAKRLEAPRRIGEVGNYIGKKKGIIILVNFSNVAFQKDNNNALYQRIANEKNFSYGDFKGSMYDYFYAQSEGKFELTFDVVGPVTVSNIQSYYGSNDSSGNDKHPAEMVIEALKLADSQVNFADYDWDGDGKVDQVYVVYAGKGEADGGASTTIWPHEWELSSAAGYDDGSGAQTLDGVKIDTYACGGELNGSGNIDGIGTMCHEFSHCLGYPDFYDTDYSGGQGMGYWDLMDGGSYNGDGYQPAGYTSYERWMAGWKEPVELTTTTQVANMKALQDGGEAYIVYNNGNRNEYFLLENRQFTGWDASLPGEGLLILHVDYNASAWAGNTPNDTPSHQRMTWIPADNEYQYTTYQGSKYYTIEGMANDPFPYGSVNAFNKSTTPAAKFFNKNTDGTYYLDSSIEEITQNTDGTVSFNFKAATNVAKPTFSPAAGRYTEAQTVTISCATEGVAIYYTIDGSTPTASSTRYTSPIVIEETTMLKAIAVNADGEESLVATAKYIIGAISDTKNFKRVTSTDELVSGMRYIIACGSKKVAAGELTTTSSASYLSPVDVSLSNDIITITDDVAVFTLEGSGSSYSFQNDETEEYLYARTTKKVAYGSTEQMWTLANGDDGVVMSYGDYGMMTYNANDPRFTTYTSAANASMIRANLYMEYDGEVPIEKQDVTMNFSSTSVTATLGKTITSPTLTTTPEGLPVTYASNNTDVATVDTSTGAVTLVAKGTTTIIASFAGNDYYNPDTASYTLTVQGPTTATNRYELVTDASTLAAGDSILIVYGTGSYRRIMATTTYKDNYREAGEFVFNDDNTITPSASDAIVVLGGQEGAWTLYVANGNETGYLSASSSSSNNMKTVQTVDKNAQAAISISSGSATIKFQGSYTRNLLKYNTSSPRFSCYQSKSTGTQYPQIYRQIKQEISSGDVNKDGDVSIADITALVNILMGQDAEQVLYDHKAADADGNGSVEAADVETLLNLILAK
ncbi:MAG: M6 family metalloprotease domain-containing protein [Prevotella sp.]|nr:M6 family metalloprotease domain-containing protein [Prevotella sp.]